MFHSVADSDRIKTFERERPHLLALAFRILGSESDAQDVLQDAWIRYARASTTDVHNVPAWLTTVVTRMCLDLLRRRRESQLPAEWTMPSTDVSDNPEALAVLAGELTGAFTIVLDRLTPPQRIALILHDVFGTPFEDVAHILDTTPTSAKKLASRARGRIRGSSTTPSSDSPAARKVVTQFLRAAQEGDIDGLIAVLHPAVTRTADPQALPPGAAQRVRRAQAVVAETRALQANARRARVLTINGRPGIGVVVEGQLRIALVFVIADDRIVHYDVVADPHRLATLRIES
jgi:RNA polymerase sigma factor (sigma-70 family)